jgi:hypothetical protein
MNIPYELTIEDIIRYLNEKRDEEPIGRCANASDCVVAQVLMQKYHLDEGEVTVSEDEITLYLDDDLPDLPLSPLLQAITQVFDDTGKLVGESVTKREFLRAWRQTYDKPFPEMNAS